MAKHNAMSWIPRYSLSLPASFFTAMVNCGEFVPERSVNTVRKDPKPKVEATAAANASVRATISFPCGLYEALEDIARGKKVSLAWVVRDAAEQYVQEKWPLFRGRL